MNFVFNYISSVAKIEAKIQKIFNFLSLCPWIKTSRIPSQNQEEPKNTVPLVSADMYYCSLCFRQLFLKHVLVPLQIQAAEHVSGRDSWGWGVLVILSNKLTKY